MESITRMIACEVAEKCIEDFKNEIHAPLTYTEATEDGSRILSYTDFGQRLYDVIYNNVKKSLEEDGSK